MELWFAFALLSTIAGGFSSFIHKIIAEHKLDLAALSVYGAAVSVALLLVGLIHSGDFSNLWHPMLIFAFLTSSTFYVTQLAKVEALKVIDTAIFFPLYKVTGPLIAIFFGLIYFGEQFSTLEWFGLLLSLTVPLLLISKAEDGRQKNLLKGILFVVLSSIIAAISIAFMKAGTDIASNLWGFVVAGELFIGCTAFLSLCSKKGTSVLQSLKAASTPFSLKAAVALGAMHALGAYTLVFAFSEGGPLGIVYTINSLYILIPIVLSIILYNEHWNTRKVIAIIISIAALGLLK